jgi:hypothetical protein
LDLLVQLLFCGPTNFILLNWRLRAEATEVDSIAEDSDQLIHISSDPILHPTTDSIRKLFLDLAITGAGTTADTSARTTREPKGILRRLARPATDFSDANWMSPNTASGAGELAHEPFASCS